ncbi:hypothetical protein JI435_403460, partial [Parastagonospora nodorum SN15]
TALSGVLMIAIIPFTVSLNQFCISAFASLIFTLAQHLLTFTTSKDLDTKKNRKVRDDTEYTKIFWHGNGSSWGCVVLAINSHAHCALVQQRLLCHTKKSCSLGWVGNRFGVGWDTYRYTYE